MKREPSQKGAKLVDRLVADPGDGKLVAFLATTYEMTPEFVATDFIPTLLGIGAWDDHAWSSRIAMEKRLAELDGAAILTAAEPYRARPRSLRLEIKPVSRRSGGCLHAKVFVAVYEECVRLIVASANLTEQGYRQNREVASVLTASEKKPSDALTIGNGLRELVRLLGESIPDTGQAVLRLARERVDGWRKEADQHRWLLWGGGQRPLWKQFADLWPTGEAIDRIVIVSPFWSEEVGHLPPVQTFVNALRAKGGLSPSAALSLLTEAAPDSQTTYKPTLPESFNSFDARALGLIASASAVDPISHEHRGAVRRLHAKMVLVEGPSTSLLYSGSANFTRHGWGFLSEPSRANLEAGLVIRQVGPARSPLAYLLPKCTGKPVSLDGAASGKLTNPAPSAPEPPWPTFVEDVRLVPTIGKPSELSLSIAVVDASQPWSVVHTAEGVEGQPLVVGVPGTYEKRVELSEAQLEQVLREQEVRVLWPELREGRLVPVNVDAAARLQLPVMPGSGALREGDLISYYQGRISWEDLFPDPDGNDHGDRSTEGQARDPGGRVDTSKIQSYIVREFVEALKGIADDIRAAAQSTPASMRLALAGAVSPVALAGRIAESAMSGKRTVTAAAFQLVEIQAILAAAEGHDVKHAQHDLWIQLLREAQDRVRALRAAFPSGLPKAFAHYERSVLRKAKAKS